MAVLSSILGFIVMLGVLIFIHEFGHFLAAKLFGVRVEVFSLGFVGRVVSFRWGETRYQIGWLPLGGYVKMLGDQFGGGELPRALQPHSFSHKPLWQRAIIILAGPLANIIVLPLLALGIIYGVQKTDYSTVIGSVAPGLPAQRAGLRPGDRIDQVNGVKTLYFRDLLKTIGSAANKKITLMVTRGSKSFRVSLTPQKDEQRGPFGGKTTRGIIGVTSHFLRAEIGVADPQSAAYKAGLRTWDRVIAVGGKAIKRWDQLVAYRAKHPAGPHRYTIRRPLFYEGPLLRFARWLPPQKIVVHPKKVRTTDGKTRYEDGILSSQLFVRAVHPGSPLHKAGIKPGDFLRKLAGKALGTRYDLESLPDKTDRQYAIEFVRGGRLYKKKFVLFSMVWVDPLKQKHPRTTLGVRLSQPYAKGIERTIDNSISYAFSRAVHDTWMFSGLLVKVIQKLFTREISTDNIGGPIMIFQIAQEAVKSGWEVFLRHMTLISINLGLINLLPIPLLDGGHLFFFLIEAIIRRPIPPRLKESALLLGLVLLLFLLLFAMKNDLQRLFAN